MADESTAPLLEEQQLGNPVPIILGFVGTIIVLIFAGALFAPGFLVLVIGLTVVGPVLLC